MTLRNSIRRDLLHLVGRLYGQDAAATPPGSILLIRPDHLGDMLFLTPVIGALRAVLPQARLSLLAGPWSAEVVRGNPCLDEVRLCRFPGFERQPKRSPLAPYTYLRKMASELRSGGYDAAVVLRFDHWWGAWLAAAAGIPQRIGYNWPETRSFLTRVISYRPDRHEVEQNARLVASLTPHTKLQMGPIRYYIAEEDRRWAAGWLASHGVDGTRPLVAIHAGAGAAVKQWPVAAWTTVGNALQEKYEAQILLTGSAGERALTEAAAAHLAPPAVNAAGETSLGRLAALQERCSLVLGSDCGPLHLAVAVGAPTVHLYGPVSPAKFGPWGDPQRHIVLVSGWPCVPCNRLDWRPAELPQHGCMSGITVEQVVSAAGLLISSRG